MYKYIYIFGIELFNRLQTADFPKRGTLLFFVIFNEILKCLKHSKTHFNTYMRELNNVYFIKMIELVNISVIN